MNTLNNKIADMIKNCVNDYNKPEYLDEHTIADEILILVFNEIAEAELEIKKSDFGYNVEDFTQAIRRRLLNDLPSPH